MGSWEDRESQERMTDSEAGTKEENLVKRRIWRGGRNGEISTIKDELGDSKRRISNLVARTDRQLPHGGDSGTGSKRMYGEDIETERSKSCESAIETTEKKNASPASGTGVAAASGVCRYEPQAAICPIGLGMSGHHRRIQRPRSHTKNDPDLFSSLVLPGTWGCSSNSRSRE